MEPSNQLNQFASNPGAPPRIGNPFRPPPQQHIQHSQRPHLVQHEYYHRAPPTSHQLVNEMSGMQLQDSMHTPVNHSSMPSLRSCFSNATGMSGQGQMATQGLMPLTAPQMGMPPRFSLPNQDQGVSSGQQLGTPLPHHLWQQQISSPMPGRFPLTGHQLSHPSSMAQQPIQQSYPGVFQPQYPQHPPAAGFPGLMPQFPVPRQPVQYHQTATELDPKSSSNGQQLGTPLPHHKQQPMPGRFPSPGHQPSHPSSMAQQPIQQSYPGVFQPQYPQHPPAAGFPGLMPQFPQQPVQQATELNPKSFPDAIQVMMKNERDRSGPFFTHAKGLLPPLVTTNYVTSDQGNASPRFVRSSLYSVPESEEMLKEPGVPFSIIVTPFAWLEKGEFAPPVVNFAKSGPARCHQCGAYICSFMRFIEAGKKLYCHICNAVTEVPPECFFEYFEYFEHLDQHTGMRTDKFQRPEVHLGSYDFVLPGKFLRVNPPSILFVMDVSHTSVKSGMVHLLCRNMKSILARLPRASPGGPQPKVGFITYSDQVDCYRLDPQLGVLQIKTVGDLKDMMMDGCLMDPTEAAGLIDKLMIKIPELFADTQQIETILGPAIEAGLEVLKQSNCSGKLLVFNTSLPVKEAPGRLKTKDEHKLLGTDNENMAFKPQTDYYEKLGKECVESGVRVDLFLAHNGFIDLATIGQVAWLTSGKIYKYTPCRAESGGELLMENGELVVKDVKQNLEQTEAFNASMRVCTSLGIRPVGFYGNFVMSDPRVVKLAGWDPDQAVTIELKHEGDLINQNGVYIQICVLYTSVAGHQRLRVHNLSLNVSSNVEDMYSYCDMDAVMNSLLKQSVSQVKVSNPVAIKEGIISRAAQILASFRRNSTRPTPASELMLPGSLQLLPLLVNSLLNCDAISGGEEMTVDARMFHIQSVISMNVEASHLYLYSSIIPLLDHTLHQRVERVVNATPICCSMDYLRNDGAYIIDNGFSLYLWVGHLVDPHWIHCVFGVKSAALIDITKTRLEEFDNPHSQMVRDALAKVRGSRQRQMRLTIIRPRDKLEYECRKLLSEDKNVFNRSSLSYPFFTRHLYREIQALLSQ